MKNDVLRSEQQKLDETIQRLENATYQIYELSDTKSTTRRKTQYGKSNREQLKKAIEEPFFGRLDVIYEGEDGERETLYFGKQEIIDQDNNQIVVDWRRPIASIYYNFTPENYIQKLTIKGKKYPLEETITIRVERKREFSIKNGKIKSIIQKVASPSKDVNATFTEDGEEDIAIIDEFLKEILQQNETTGYMKEIIATIQKEQDAAIRQPINRNVIIQGVAGSGKSSIALHRLSFLLFNNKHISPEHVLILGPSKLFISSFQGLLPELDLEGIQQMTFQQLALQILQPVLKKEVNVSINWYFENVLFTNESEEKKRIQFKGSSGLAQLLDHFVEEMKRQYIEQMQAIAIFDERLSREQLQEIWNGYSYLSFSKQMERFFQHVRNHFEHVMKTKVAHLTEQYESIIHTFLANGGLTKEEYKDVTKKIKSVYDYKVQQLEKQWREGFSQWKKKMEFPSILSIYQRALSYELLTAFSHELDEEIPLLFRDYHLEQITYFDLPPLLYIYLLLHEKPVSYAHIVVDEAQDFSYMHFAVLQKLTKTMTILGDKDQSIYVGYGQDNWENVMNNLLKSDEDCLLQNKNTEFCKENVQSLIG
ncbi:HelD family protein [Parageobacillus thermoglucosidasius]|uniref:HelD family protein n=1 Tax=Parageobacillus thermoglucosidasius TaxID=1426 RepID=UPI000E1308AD|nr:UvrD-helicase domain-containing protein [Parageobacillus thermoglucosidasius]RDE27545.1 hypothetical protein DV714_10365 [Parageobacillus thermoglucosidasius]